MAKLNEKMITETLMNWNTLHSRIMSFNEKQLQVLLEAERNRDNRRHIVLRLHQRFCSIRTRREREDLLN